MTTIKRRIEQLESAQPESSPRVRVVLQKSWELPVAILEAGPNEQVFVVHLVETPSSRLQRLSIEGPGPS